jgi:phenylacetate-coenzyme A ligase PaaK-like adenylate-forming protein
MDNEGMALQKLLKAKKVHEYCNKIPIVYVYARKNLATTLYGVLIYPDFIKSALLKRSVSHLLTGKFVIIKKHNKDQNQYLEINLELRKGIKSARKYNKVILNEIIKALKYKSSEYTELAGALKTKANPKLKFWNYEDPKYFSPGFKHKWVVK